MEYHVTEINTAGIC